MTPTIRARCEAAIARSERATKGHWGAHIAVADPGSPMLGVCADLPAFARALMAACDALEEIKQGKGAFSRDQYEHAANCVEKSKRDATEGLAEVGRLLGNGGTE